MHDLGFCEGVEVYGVRCAALARFDHVFVMPSELSREVVLQLARDGCVLVVLLSWVGELVVQVVGQMMAAGM